MKDQEYTEKEILSQQNRIQSVPPPLAATAATAATATAAAATTVTAVATEITSTGCPAQVKDNPEKDEHDVKKQEEVLAEYLGARGDEFERLKDFTGKLKEFMVRALAPAPSLALALALALALT